jgi:phosphoglycolate phosphatase-like HAD superfamily hydrolase
MSQKIHGHFKACVFDIDGTLRRFYEIWHEGFSQVVGDLRKEFNLSKADVLTIIRHYTDAEPRFHDFQMMALQLAANRPRKIPEHRGMMPLDETKALLLGRKWQKYMDSLAIKKVLYPGVAETLQALNAAGVLLGIYSDAPKGAILNFLWLFRHQIPADIFSHIVVRGQMGIDHGLPDESQPAEERAYKEEIMSRVHKLGDDVIKPQPNVILEHFPDKWGVRAEDVVYVGDTIRDYQCTLDPVDPKKAAYFVLCDTKRYIPELALSDHHHIAPKHDKRLFIDEGHDNGNGNGNGEWIEGLIGNPRVMIIDPMSANNSFSSILRLFDDAPRGPQRKFGKVIANANTGLPLPG